MSRRALLILGMPAFLLTTLILGSAVVITIGGGDPEERLPDLIPWIIMINHSVVLGAFVGLVRGEALTPQDIGWNRLGVPRLAVEIVLGIVLGALIVLFDEVVFDAIERVFDSTPVDVGPGGVDIHQVPVAWLVAATVFPFVEETVYRGYGIGVVGRRTSTALAVVVSCVFFGLLHWGQGAWGILNTAGIGALLAGIFLWRRNLWSPTAAHMAFNVIQILREAG